MCQASCRTGQPAQGRGPGLFGAGKKTNLLQTISFQGLLIPWPAAGHVNPVLSDRAVCPGAASPPARDDRLTELTSLPGRAPAPAQRSVPQAGPQRRQSALQLTFKISHSRTTDVGHMQLHRGGGRRACVSWARWGLGPCLSRDTERAVLEQNELLKTCISFGGNVKILRIHRAAGLAGWEAFYCRCLEL